MSTSRVGTLDPAPPRPTERGGGGRWAWLVTASGIVEAELIRGVLDAASVPVVLDRRDPSPFAWMYLAGNVNAPVQVYVPATLLDAAKLALMDAGLLYEPEPPLPPGPAVEPHRVVRIVLLGAALAATVWIVLLTYFGSATCALRLVC